MAASGREKRKTAPTDSATTMTCVKRAHEAHEPDQPDDTHGDGDGDDWLALASEVVSALESKDDVVAAAASQSVAPCLPSAPKSTAASAVTRRKLEWKRKFERRLAEEKLREVQEKATRERLAMDAREASLIGQLADVTTRLRHSETRYAELSDKYAVQAQTHERRRRRTEEWAENLRQSATAERHRLEQKVHAAEQLLRVTAEDCDQRLRDSEREVRLRDDRLREAKVVLAAEHAKTRHVTNELETLTKRTGCLSETVDLNALVARTLRESSLPSALRDLIQSRVLNHRSSDASAAERPLRLTEQEEEAVSTVTMAELLLVPSFLSKLSQRMAQHMAESEDEIYQKRWFHLSARLAHAAHLRTHDCPVCKEELSSTPTLRLRVLSCGHRLCANCLDRVAVLRVHPNTCPLCRAAIVHSSPFIL